jgi:hypothetical protein
VPPHRPQALFATDVFPRALHFAPGAPLLLGVAASFGPWSVRCDVVDARGADGAPRLRAPALTLWDVLSADFSYHLPLLPVDEAAAASGADAAAAAAAATAAGTPWLGLRTAAAPRMPPVAHMPFELRAALPLVVTGCDGDDAVASGGDGGGGDDGSDVEEAEDAESDAPPGGGDAAPRIIIRRWSATALAAPRCVRVRITFTRPRRAAPEAGCGGDGRGGGGDDGE